MPLNMNTIGMGNSSGNNSGDGNGLFTDTYYEELLGYSLSNINLDTLKTLDGYETAGILKSQRSGSQNMQNPNYPSIFFELNETLYGVVNNKSCHSVIYKIDITWSSPSQTNGILSSTNVASINSGTGYISTVEVVAGLAYLVVSPINSWKCENARLYRFDGNSVTDLFGKEITDLTDKYGNIVSSSHLYNAQHHYQISPIVTSSGGACERIMIIGMYYNGSSSTNPNYVYLYQIKIYPEVEVELITYAGANDTYYKTDYSFKNIFTDNGKMFVICKPNSYVSTYQFKYQITTDENTHKNSISLTDLSNQINSNKRSSFGSIISNTLNNQYLFICFNEGDSSSASQVCLLVTVKNGDFEIKQISITSYWTSTYIDDVWEGPYFFITFNHQTPYILVSYNCNSYSWSDYYYIYVGGSQIISPFTADENDGIYHLSGYFEKGDTLYSDDGIYEYTFNESTVTLESDVMELVIPESGIYEIRSRSNHINPLYKPPLTIKTTHGTIDHLKLSRIDKTTIEASLTSNLSINGENVTEGGLARYSSDTGRFVISVKE